MEGVCVEAPLTFEVWFFSTEIEFDGLYLRQVPMLRVLICVTVCPEIIQTQDCIGLCIILLILHWNVAIGEYSLTYFDPNTNLNLSNQNLLRLQGFYKKQ